MRMTANADAARRIVAINTKLTQVMDAETRERLISEQRTIWEGLFPGRAFEEIAGTVH